MINFTRTVIEAVLKRFGEEYVLEPQQSPHTERLYVESHLALALLLLYIVDGRRDRDLDLATYRLCKWEELNEPLTFFNAFAVLLSRIVVSQQKVRHAPLVSILDRLCLAHKRDNAKALAETNCGNNMYMQQVVSDRLLYPLAIGDSVPKATVDGVLREFARFQSKEGFYFDFPREGPSGRLFPLTYCLKFLFLMGLSANLLEDRVLLGKFVTDMRVILPWMSRDGGFSYLGRTDNSTFASGLSIFNLRCAAGADEFNRRQYQELAYLQEKLYRSTPCTHGGYLEVNRLQSVELTEHRWSRDVYAYPAQYSVTSCVYILLAELLTTRRSMETPGKASTRREYRYSEDLGMARLTDNRQDVIIRTISQPEAEDRRYLGPTILRSERDGSLLVGAVPLGCAEDLLCSSKPARRVGRVFQNLWHRYRKGEDEVDARYVGFVPVLLDHSSMFSPVMVFRQEISSSHVEFEYCYGRVRFRGWVALLKQLRSYILASIGRSASQDYATTVVPANPIRLTRRVSLNPRGVLIKDSISGPLRGKVLEFFVRLSPEAIADVPDLTMFGIINGWSSDGRVRIQKYRSKCHASEISYTCLVHGFYEEAYSFEDSASVVFV